MKNFVLKELVNTNLEVELERIGFDIAYRSKAADKFQYKTFKIFDLTIPQANILKQTALSFGADCGVHREVLTNNIDKTDVIIGGSFAQLKKICEKLKLQPFSLKLLAETIENQLSQQERKTKLVGILNLTPDSFSDGGMYFNEALAIKQLYQLIEDGADVIDIGAESTRPGSISVDAEEQIKRLSIVIGEVKKLPIPISVDTRSSVVAKFALDNGVRIINDVSGLDYDTKLIDVVSQYDAEIIIQHSTGNSNNIITYKDVVEDVYKVLLQKVELAKSNGINKIILDVGIGFGKSKDDCIKLLDRIEEFYSLNLPIMVGLSRKSFLGVTEENNYIKDSLSASLSYQLMQKRIDYLRVHNVKLHKQLLNLVK